MEQKFIIILDSNLNEKVILNTEHIISVALKLETGTGKPRATITLSNEKSYTVEMPHAKIIKALKPLDPGDDNVSSPIGYVKR